MKDSVDGYGPKCRQRRQMVLEWQLNLNFEPKLHGMSERDKHALVDKILSAPLK